MDDADDERLVMAAWENPGDQPEMVEIREAYSDLRRAEARVAAAREAVRAAGWVLVGTNRYARAPNKIP